MKITLFIPGLGNGGAERVFIRLFKYLKSCGHDVDLLVASKKGVLVDTIDINVTYLNANRSLLSFIKYFKYLQRRKPDIVLSTLSSSIIVSGIVKLFHKSNSHEYILISRIANLIDPLTSSKVRLYFESIALKQSDAVISNSSASIESVFKHLGLKINSNNLKIISNPVLDDNYRSKIYGHSKVITMNKEIVFIGRFVPQKQIHHAIKAFQIIASSIPNARLTMIGDGPQSNKARNIIDQCNLSEKVVIKKFHEDIPSLLLNSDCLINTSKYEGFGNIFIEALAFCDHLVCYQSAGGASELLNNTDAILVPQGDIESLANAAIEALSSEEKNELNTTFLDRYTQSNIGKEYESFISKIFSSQK